MLSDHTLNIQKNNFIYRLSEAALLLVAGAYVLISDIAKATLRLGVPQDWERYVIYALVPVVLFRILVVLLQEKEVILNIFQYFLKNHIKKNKSYFPLLKNYFFFI